MRKRPVTSASAEPGLASQEQPPLPGERSQWLPKAAVLCGSASASGNGLFLRAIIAESCDFRNPAGRTRQKKDLSGLHGCPRRSPGITKLLQTCPNSVRVPLVESPLGWDFQKERQKERNKNQGEEDRGRKRGRRGMLFYSKNG
ncbi:uncharacterized protein LOC144579825 isoform X2 [Callithrix jacchus]